MKTCARLTWEKNLKQQSLCKKHCFRPKHLKSVTYKYLDFTSRQANVGVTGGITLNLITKYIFLLQTTGKVITKKDLHLLFGKVAPRLGEDLKTEYEETVLKVQKDDIFFFYTDGLLEVRDPKGQPWLERNLIKVLAQSVTEKRNAS